MAVNFYKQVLFLKRINDLIEKSRRKLLHSLESKRHVNTIIRDVCCAGTTAIP